MSVTGILAAIAVIGGTGLFIGLFLGAAANAFKVKVDEREEEVLAALPGNNCGGCGYPGCSGLAAAIVRGEAPVGACPVGGEQTAAKIAGIMGTEAETGMRQTAFVQCAGDCDKTTVDYEYHGTQDCQMLAFVPGGGAKTCQYGCLGYGNCVKACQFDAIHVENGIAVVDKEACKACGKCVEACPKNLITMIPYTASHVVACSSKDKGPATMKACTVGCIGCGICKKNCPQNAITVEDFNAYIDQDKCTGCGICKEKCPKKSIV